VVTSKAPLYTMRVAYVDPRGTTSSREHDEAVRGHGLDKRTASAYLMALKHLQRP